MSSSSMLELIRNAWGWTGLDPAEIVATNSFGNVIVRARDNSYWRICPEQLSSQKMALNAVAFEAIFQSGEFVRDWEMTRIVEVAKRTLGPLPEGRCYCLKVPAIIGGSYDEANLGTVSLRELLSYSGELASQIKDVPDGALIRIIVDRH